MVTIETVETIPYRQLLDELKPVYSREVPEFGVDKTHHLNALSEELIFFSNSYAFISELWAVMIHHVRVLKHEHADKALIDAAMDKRDMMDQMLAATKLKYHAVSRLMQFYGAPDYQHGR